MKLYLNSDRDIHVILAFLKVLLLLLKLLCRKGLWQNQPELYRLKYASPQ
jgi:hypothetical protein